VCWAFVFVFSFAGDRVGHFVHVDLFSGVSGSSVDCVSDFQVCGGLNEAFRDDCGFMARVDCFRLPVHGSRSPAAA